MQGAANGAVGMRVQEVARAGAGCICAAGIILKRPEKIGGTTVLVRCLHGCEASDQAASGMEIGATCGCWCCC